MLPPDGLEQDGNIEERAVVEHKYILTVPVMGRFKEVAVKDAQHKDHKIRPALAKPVDKIAALDLPKERCCHHQRKDQQQEGREGQKGINGKKDPQGPAYEWHNQGRI